MQIVTPINYKFPKEEKLCNRADIDSLFLSKYNKVIFPLKIIYKDNTKPNNQILMIVGKRNFKRAVDRNLLKRRMREAYRLNKNIIASLLPKFDIAFVFTNRSITDFSKIEESIIHLLNHLKTSTLKV